MENLGAVSSPCELENLGAVSSPYWMENLSSEFLVFWEEEYEEEKRGERARWKPSEMKIFMELMMLIKRKKMAELEDAYAKKQELKRAGEEGMQAHKKLMMLIAKHAPDYHRFRRDWMATHPDLSFEDITKIRAMIYTKSAVPKYVYYGSSDSVQISWVRVEQESLPWPLHVFGVVAVRDCIDPKRNLIFNRERDDSQTLTDKDPFLVLSGPSRAVVANQPVSFEAELKVKGAVESEDSYFILDFKIPPLTDGVGLVQLTGTQGSKLEIGFEGLKDCVEATVFIRLIDGTWPDDLRGTFLAGCGHKAVLIEGDSTSIRCDGNMKHLRHVVSVPYPGFLTVLFDSHGIRVIERALEAKLSGRSYTRMALGSVVVGVLVAWSRIRPVCEELVDDDHLYLCHQ